MTPHLTPEQLDSLLAPAPVTPHDAVVENESVILAKPESPHLSSSNQSESTAAHAHLLLCPACAAELANLRDSLSLFRQASVAHANSELQSLPPISVPNRGLLFPALQPAHWVAVAATLLIALLPLQSFRARPIQSAPAETYAAADTTQSDAALLDDVDREASASVPAPMQALADPTQSDYADTVSTQTPDPTPTQYPAQRNDQP
jgi:hypothetical protein